MTHEDAECLNWSDDTVRLKLKKQGEEMETIRAEIRDLKTFNAKLTNTLTLLLGVAISNLGVNIIPILAKAFVGHP